MSLENKLEQELSKFGIEPALPNNDDSEKVLELLEKIEENTRKRKRGSTVYPTDPYDPNDELECPYEVDSDNEYCTTWCHYCEQYGALYNKPSSWRSMSFFDEPVTKLLTLPLALLFAPLGTLRGGDNSLLNSNIEEEKLLIEQTVNITVKETKEEVKEEEEVKAITENSSWLEDMKKMRLEIDALDKLLEKSSSKKESDKSDLQMKFEKAMKRRIA